MSDDAGEVNSLLVPWVDGGEGIDDEDGHLASQEIVSKGQYIGVLSEDGSVGPERQAMDVLASKVDIQPMCDGYDAIASESGIGVVLIPIGHVGLLSPDSKPGPADAKTKRKMQSDDGLSSPGD